MKDLFIRNEDAWVSGTSVILTVGIAFLTMMILPGVGDRIGDVADIPAGSNWNATENTDLVTGAELEGCGIVLIAIIVVAITLRGTF